MWWGYTFGVEWPDTGHKAAWKFLQNINEKLQIYELVILEIQTEDPIKDFHTWPNALPLLLPSTWGHDRASSMPFLFSENVEGMTNLAYCVHSAQWNFKEMQSCSSYYVGGLFHPHGTGHNFPACHYLVTSLQIAKSVSTYDHIIAICMISSVGDSLHLECEEHRVWAPA